MFGLNLLSFKVMLSFPCISYPSFLLSTGSGSINESQRELVVSKNLPASITNASSNQNGPEIFFDENDSNRTTNVAFSSMPTMHINEEMHLGEMQMAQNLAVSGSGGRIFSKSCPEPVIYRRTSEACSSKDSQMGARNQTGPFTPHWSTEAVNKELKVGYHNSAVI